VAIVKMRKLNLIAMSYDKDGILDALHRTNAAEITLHADTEDTDLLPFEEKGIEEYLSSSEAALGALCGAVEARQKAEKIKNDLLKDGFEVSYSQFVAAKDKKAEMDGLIERINALLDEKNRLKGEYAKCEKLLKAAAIYQKLALPFSAFCATSYTKTYLGILPLAKKEGWAAELSACETAAFSLLNEDGENALVCAVVHKAETEYVDGVLSSYGFVESPFLGEEYKEKTGEELYRAYEAESETLRGALKENEGAMYALKEYIRPLKIYCDYLAFCLEKEKTAEKMRATETTFLLQAYVPAPAEEEVKAQIQSVSKAVYIEFSDPTEEETPPTLLKNNGLVSSFEGITNTYSVPHYREFDPNTVMAFFYSLFMGFIIGDLGYGIVMLFGGGYIWWKHRARPTGMSRLAGAFAIGGIFAIIWGCLFNSLFGFAILPSTIMPNPQTDMWHLLGIAVPSVLIIAMLIGIVQLCVGYICKAVQEWLRGNILDGVFDGVVWTVFSVGVGLAILGFLEEVGLPALGKIGGITAGVSLGIAILTAGRKEKFFGKFTKGFGTAYGVINYASDILSYARLYGLMLSGAVIAQIIANYSYGFFLSGNVLLMILAVVLLVVGNAFNLIINLLGAYIHDARLQYVEFYGRFYEGDGELFRPLGGERKYISLLPATASSDNQK